MANQLPENVQKENPEDDSGKTNFLGFASTASMHGLNKMADRKHRWPRR